MTASRPRIAPEGVALFTDLYELTMAQAYLANGMTGEASFSLFVRKLPERRNFLMAAGLGPVLDHLEGLRFGTGCLDWLAGTGRFSDRFLTWLGEMRFEGSVRAIPEGTPVFPDEPILEITAPVAQAQIVETLVLNQISLGTMLASKAVRHVLAAGGRTVVDFGARRMHGLDAALKGARAFHIAGVDATSNVLAGMVYGLPVSGTMAHSYVQCFDDEAEAFRSFAGVFPETILLVDTYDTEEGVRKVVRLARELGKAFRVRGIRLDSGDLAALAFRAREILDEAGLGKVEIFASGGIDEDRIAALVAGGAPVDGFGVGTAMGVSSDAPAFDIAYKLVEYGGRGRMKLSEGKATLPGRKQVFRVEEHGVAVRDVIAREGERLPGRPLLEEVMRDGRRVRPEPPLDTLREVARGGVARLPAALRSLDPPPEPYPVALSDALAAHRDAVAAKIRRAVEAR